MDATQEVEGTGLTPQEFAQIFGVDAHLVGLAVDPDAERLAERKHLADIFGVDMRYFSEEGAENDNG